MTDRARQHVIRARAAIGRSDAALMEAATEIRRALEADATLTLGAVGAEIGRSGDWITALLRWADSHDDGEAMYAADSAARLRRATRQGFRELSGETILALMEEAGVHFRGLLQPDMFDKDGSYIGPEYTPQDISRPDHFRRYQLSRLNPWGMRYDWKSLSHTEKCLLAPELEQKLDSFVSEVRGMLSEVSVTA
jgi:hypothetical protein